MPKYRGGLIKYVYFEAENEEAAFIFLWIWIRKMNSARFGSKKWTRRSNYVGIS